MLKAFTLLLVALAQAASAPGPWSMVKLPDTGQSVASALNSGGTVTDAGRGLMWQQIDAGEMTWEDATLYASALTLSGHHDWRLPTARELFSIFDHGRNPALDPAVFPRTTAEYWWSSETLASDPNRVWVTNSGGGIGPHPRSETLSAGGEKRFHVRCVRDLTTHAAAPPRPFAPNGDRTVTDLVTGLIWQQDEAPADMTWDDAQAYARSLDLGSHRDWRMPTIKELQSIHDISRTNPAINREAFPAAQAAEYWSSTTMFSRDSSRTWVIDFRLGIGSYTAKTALRRIRCVRDGR